MGSLEVDEMIASRDHPLGETVLGVRGVLLSVPRVIESIKWNSPNYALADDFATMHIARDDVVQLVLHTGAKPKPDHPVIVVEPLPAGAKRADRNRLVLSYRAPSLSPEELDELAAVVRSWTEQLAAQ